MPAPPAPGAAGRGPDRATGAVATHPDTRRGAPWATARSTLAVDAFGSIHRMLVRDRLRCFADSSHRSCPGDRLGGHIEVPSVGRGDERGIPHRDDRASLVPDGFDRGPPRLPTLALDVRPLPALVPGSGAGLGPPALPRRVGPGLDRGLRVHLGGERLVAVGNQPQSGGGALARGFRRPDGDPQQWRRQPLAKDRPREVAPPDAPELRGSKSPSLKPRMIAAALATVPATPPPYSGGSDDIAEATCAPTAAAVMGVRAPPGAHRLTDLPREVRVDRRRLVVTGR